MGSAADFPGSGFNRDTDGSPRNPAARGVLFPAARGMPPPGVLAFPQPTGETAGTGDRPVAGGILGVRVNAAGVFAELKRRNVWRACALYAGAVWALAQGIAQLGPTLNAPEWITRWFLVACIVGFPLWVAFAWFYAWTPGGFKREEDVQRDPSRVRGTGRKLDFAIIGVLAVAVVLLATNQFVRRNDATSRGDSVAIEQAQAELAKLPSQSVAVLPLANESGDPRQQYFSDGLSEELISSLTQINGLKVIGKYSSFKFRDSNDHPARIGATLGVAHLIEGSVRQSGKDLRIVVNLIRASDGASIWSHTYDQQLKDVFAIQSQIGMAVAGALKIQLLGQQPGIDEKPPSGNVEAYRAILQGRVLARTSTEAGFRQGAELYRQALALDPNYVYAWGGFAIVQANLGLAFLQGDARQQAFTEARKAADKAAALAPDASMSHLVRGYILAQMDNDPAAALVELKKAYARAPNDGTAIGFLAGGLSGAGQFRQAAEMYHKAIGMDPLRVDNYAGLAYVLQALGQFEAAEQAANKSLSLQPTYLDGYSLLGFIAMARGEFDATERYARRMLEIHPGDISAQAFLAATAILRGDVATARREASKISDPRARASALASLQQISGDAKAADASLRDYMAKHDKDDPLGIAQLYALRKQPDEMFQWLDRARNTPGAYLAGALLSDPLLLRYKNDPRFARLCKALGLPLPGESLPEATAQT